MGGPIFAPSSTVPDETCTWCPVVLYPPLLLHRTVKSRLVEPVSLPVAGMAGLKNFLRHGAYRGLARPENTELLHLDNQLFI